MIFMKRSFKKTTQHFLVLMGQCSELLAHWPSYQAHLTVARFVKLIIYQLYLSCVNPVLCFSYPFFSTMVNSHCPHCYYDYLHYR